MYFMSLVPFYSGARCDAKARGPIIRAFAEHRAQRPRNSGFWQFSGRLAVLEQGLWGMVWVLVGTVV